MNAANTREFPSTCKSISRRRAITRFAKAPCSICRLADAPSLAWPAFRRGALSESSSGRPTSDLPSLSSLQQSGGANMVSSELNFSECLKSTRADCTVCFMRRRVFPSAPANPFSRRVLKSIHDLPIVPPADPLGRQSLEALLLRTLSIDRPGHVGCGAIPRSRLQSNDGTPHRTRTRPARSR